ncbi:MAG: penicillin-binding transpeptidase domain-containing protein, partial [Acidimicrobiia bacterium]
MSERPPTPQGIRFRDGRIRIAILGTIILSLFSALVLRLYYLQVLTHDDHAAAAEFNRVRVIPIEPTRGKIYDRNGKLLVRNRQSLVVAVRRDVMDDPEGTISRLATLLNSSPEEIKKRLADKTALPYTAIAIAEDVPESTVVYIREHIDQFRGVVDEFRPVRVYPYGALASHALGYTGEITSEQLEQKRYKEKDYRLGSIVGRSGVEYAYEHDLRGREGLIKIQVDASGKVRGNLPGGDITAVPGRDLVTTLDIEIQKLVEESLAQGLLNARTIYDRESNKKYFAPAGGAVVLDPRNGEILAMASFPTYDPSIFVGGITKAEFDALRNDPAKPLLDRVTQAAFP